MLDSSSWTSTGGQAEGQKLADRQSAAKEWVETYLFSRYPASTLSLLNSQASTSKSNY